jgi:hypothetical protein
MKLSNSSPLAGRSSREMVLGAMESFGSNEYVRIDIKTVREVNSKVNWHFLTLNYPLYGIGMSNPLSCVSD